MTNTSPLEVKYKWYFLRRPPVRRQDPEQCDEGVDMQSECETDSLAEGDSSGESQEEDEEMEGGEEGEEENEEGEEEEEEEGEEGEEEEEEDTEGGQVLEMQGEEESCSHDPEDSLEKEDIQGSQSGLQPSGGNAMAEGTIEGEYLEPPTDTINQQEAAAAIVIPTTTASVSDTSGSTAGLAARGERKEKQPWELVDDPFKLVRIEQVMTHHWVKFNS